MALLSLQNNTKLAINDVNNVLQVITEEIDGTITSVGTVHIEALDSISKWTTPSYRDNLAADATLKTANWDNNGNNGINLAGGSSVTTPTYIWVSSDVDIHIALDASANKWTGEVGATLSSGQTHIVPCCGMTYLHFKGVSADGTIYVTVFGE